MMQIKKSKVKIIILFIISIITLYFGYEIFYYFKIGYRLETKNYKKYYWLLNDSIKKDINKKFFTGYIRQKDNFYQYLYKNSFIIIWEFKDLESIKLENIFFNQNVNLSKIKLKSEWIFNLNNPHIRMNPVLNFNNIINVNIDGLSKIISKIDTLNHKGFYGEVNHMSISNEDKHLIVFEFDLPRTSLVLLFKHNKSIFLLMVNSKDKLDESIINIFNLE